MHTRLHDISHESIFIQIMNVLPMPYISPNMPLTYPVTHSQTLSLSHTRMPAHTHTHDNRLDNVALTPNHLAHSSIMKALQKAGTKDLSI